MHPSGSQSQGDTQPVSQWVYQEFTNRELQRAVSTRSEVDEGIVYGGNDASHSIQQGQTGHVDLLGIFEQPSNVDVDELSQGQDRDNDPLSQAPDVRADIFPEHKRFQQPKTPASQSRKRKRGSEANSQEMGTPGLPTNPFAGQMGNIDGLMDPSQLFKATQALTSPLTNMLPSDGSSDRPSPNMHNLQRPSTAGTLSSPAGLPRSGMVRAVTEPQTTYVSMKESQEAREKILQAMKSERDHSLDELSDDDFAYADTQLRRRLNQQRIDLEAKAQFSGVTARSELVPSGRGRGRGGRLRNAPSRISPRRTGREASEPVIISDDAPPEDTQGNITEDETEREEDNDAEEEDDIDELAEDNKENVEVPRTIARAQHGTSQMFLSQPTPSHSRLRKTKGSSQARRVVQTNSSPQVTRSQENLIGNGNGNWTQPDAIADSQPSQSPVQSKHASDRPGTRAFSEPRSSLDSRILIPQSQSSEDSRFNLSTNSRAITQIEKATSQVPPSSPPNYKSLQHDKPANGPIKEFKTKEDEEGAAEISPSKEGSSNGPPVSEGMPNSQHPISVLARQDMRPSGHSMTNRDRNTQEPTNNSSSLIPSPRITPKSASQPASTHSLAEQSRPSTLFESAQEHLSPSPSKTHVQNMQRRSQSQQSSPTKFKRPRTIGEIAADPSPPDALGDVDVDINILSNEDVEFQRALSGSSPIAPARKRRRGGRGLAIQAAEPGSTKLPPLPQSPLPPPSSAISAITPAHASSEADLRSPANTKVTAREAKKQGLQPRSAREGPAREQALDARAASAPKSVKENAAADVRAELIAADSSSSAQPPDATPQSITAEAASRLPVTAPNRVFAHFNGTTPAYHPATCLRVIDGHEPRYTVRFDDGTVDSIAAYSIKRLELRAGDLVKVDLPGSRTKTFVVEGMRDQQRPVVSPDPVTPSRRGRAASTNDSAFPETDIHGYATVLVSPRQRASVEGYQPTSSQIAVPLAQLYLTQTMWSWFKNRQYIHTSNKPLTLTGLQTPSERPSTPSTPSSRTRRAKPSGLTQSRSISASTRSNDGIFNNMAFAVTNVGRSEDNERIKTEISSNGGIILDNGFDELFRIPPLARTTGPQDLHADASFKLTPAAKDLGFTCLIADKYCRRAKFIQALALGIPCLATRWITDCVIKQCVLPWAPYLLPSGESAFLGGAARSRILQPFTAEVSTLSEIIENRPKMLDNASVLLIMEKGQEEIMKQHPLITHALGASKIARAINEDAAVKAVSDAQALGQPWDFVFSYNKEKAVEDRLFGTNQTGRKRKRGRESEVHAGQGRDKRSKIRVVGNEFVIQSLILGMLVEE